MKTFLTSLVFGATILFTMTPTFAVENSSPIAHLPEGTTLVLRQALVLPAGERDINFDYNGDLVDWEDAACSLTFNRIVSYERVFNVGGDNITVRRKKDAPAVYSSLEGWGEPVEINVYEGKSVYKISCWPMTIAAFKVVMGKYFNIMIPSAIDSRF